MGCAMLLGQRAFGIRTGSANELQAQRLCPLGGDQADAAGRCMKQHKIASVQAALRLGALEQVLRSQALEHHRCAGLKRDGVGQTAHSFCRHHPQLAVAARRLAGIGRAVAGLEVAHALAHRLHHTGGFHTHLQRHRQGVEAGALVNVDVIQTHCLVTDADLAGAGIADHDIHHLQNFGATVVVNAYRLTHSILQKNKKSSGPLRLTLVDKSLHAL